ncbi:hypothetical protein D9M72_381860 [compost metagenome]
MVGHHHGDAFIAMYGAAQLADGRGGAQQRLRRKAAQHHDHPGLHQRDLAAQERLALRHFLGLRVAVAGRAALEHVGDKHIAPARQPERAEHIVEQLAGLAHEGLALQVFVLAGGFAHQHPFGLAVAHAEHGIGAVLAQAAGGAACHGGVQRRPFHAGDGSFAPRLRRAGFRTGGDQGRRNRCPGDRRRHRRRHRHGGFRNHCGKLGHRRLGNRHRCLRHGRLRRGVCLRIRALARHPFGRDAQDFQELCAAAHALPSVPSLAAAAAGQLRRSTSASSRLLPRAG